MHVRAMHTLVGVAHEGEANPKIDLANFLVGLMSNIWT